MKNLINSLKNPENQYKPTPFWSWNDKLEPEELRRQIHEMKKVGLGGYFMHARGGLRTEYLSEDWFDCVKTCIEEGSALGMDSWSYDEDGWPSGFGGGIVTAMGDEYHVKWLECGIYGKDTPSGAVLGYYTIKDNQYTYIGNAVDETPNETVWFVCQNKNLYYVDILDEKVVKAFIDCTYEEYYKQIEGNIKNKTMPGFFTDEPQFSNGHTPWSYVIPDKFTANYGYSPFEHLICLFKDVDGAKAFRTDFWRLVNDLYTKSFGKQIYDWCNEHGCEWTGHVMCEDNLHAQMRCTAGAMPFYEYMHRPGIDWLCRSIASPIIPKQVSSAARQLGKKFVLTETFALCGWDVSFEELKWIAEWQFVNGVNSICQHLESYSIRGCRKRDYPPSIFYQSPWWDETLEFNEYFSKLGKLLADSEEEAPVLVLHPLHSAWTTYDDTNNPSLRKFDEEFEYVVNELAALHIPYHLGDETIIANHGRVMGDKFVIGNCEYSAVVLPGLETLDESTYLLLKEFTGPIASIGTAPTMINGRPDTRISDMKFESLIKDDEIILKYASKYNLKNISVTDSDGEVKSLRYCARIISSSGSEKAYFIHNQDRYGSYDAKVKVDGKHFALLSLLDMSLSPFDGHLHFDPMQSYVLLTSDTPFEYTSATAVPPSDLMQLKMNRAWDIERCSPNSLTLDYVSYSIDGGLTYDGPYAVLDVMDKLLHRQYNDKIIFKYVFNISPDTVLTDIPEFSLVHEYSADNLSASVNGFAVPCTPSGWWVDKVFNKFDITPFIKHGVNEILISGKFYQQKKVYDVLFGKNVHETERNKLTYDTEIESVYLTGDFSVYSLSEYTEGPRKALFTDGGFVICNKNTSLTGGELVSQGYPFFRGNIVLSQSVDIGDNTNRFIKFKKPFAAVAKLFVNDVFVRNIMWADYSTDLSAYLKPGVNKISFELIIGNRNLLGPHHNPGGECYAVNPGSFGPNGNYSVHNWRNRYCFVKTGFND